MFVCEIKPDSMVPDSTEAELFKLWRDTLRIGIPRPTELFNVGPFVRIGIDARGLLFAAYKLRAVQPTPGHGYLEIDLVVYGVPACDEDGALLPLLYELRADVIASYTGARVGEYDGADNLVTQMVPPKAVSKVHLTTFRVEPRNGVSAVLKDRSAVLLGTVNELFLDLGVGLMDWLDGGDAAARKVLRTPLYPKEVEQGLGDFLRYSRLEFGQLEDVGRLEMRQYKFGPGERRWPSSEPDYEGWAH